MIVDSLKCLECKLYNNNDYSKFSCEKYDKIEDKIIDGLINCKYFQKTEKII